VQAPPLRGSLPFGLALGLDLLVATPRVNGLGARAGLLAGGAAAAIALACSAALVLFTALWLAWPLVARRPKRRPVHVPAHA